MSFHAWRKTQARAEIANEFSKARLQDANRPLRHIVEAMNASMKLKRAGSTRFEFCALKLGCEKRALATLRSLLDSLEQAVAHQACKRLTIDFPDRRLG